MHPQFGNCNFCINPLLGQCIWYVLQPMGMLIHWGAWSGNCVFARNPACGNRLTTNWSWTSRVKRQVDTQSACRNDLLLAVANANKNVILSVRHFRSMTSSLALSFAPSVNRGGEKLSGLDGDPTEASIFVGPAVPTENCGAVLWCVGQ